MIMVLRLAGSAALLGLLLALSLATGLVVARLAAHMRDEGWARLSAQGAMLRRKETLCHCAHRHDFCTTCGLPIGGMR